MDFLEYDSVLPSLLVCTMLDDGEDSADVGG